MSEVKVIKAENEDPICPHCNEKLKSVKAKAFKTGWLSVTEKYVYFCPHCDKVLGIGQSAWMV